MKELKKIIIQNDKKENLEAILIDFNKTGLDLSKIENFENITWYKTNELHSIHYAFLDLGNGVWKVLKDRSNLTKGYPYILPLEYKTL